MIEQMIEQIAEEMTMEKRRIVHTAGAPAALGPYSQAVVHGGVVYTAGQIALDPLTGTLVGEGDPARETEQVFANLAAVLGAAGSSLAQALRCDVFLADLGDYEAVNAVYARYLGAEAPARLAVQVARLPRDARVEIACMAAVATPETSTPRS